MSDPSRMSVRLRNVALAAIAETCETSLESDKSQEAAWLQQLADSTRIAGTTLTESLRSPSPDDARLVKLARELSLSSVEILAVALACAVEEETIVGRVLAHLQAPVGGSRPTLGLLSHAFATAVEEGLDILPALLNGVAVQSGLLVVLIEGAPLPERPVTVPAPLCFALAGRDSQWPGATIGLNGIAPMPLPDSVRVEAKRQAAALDAEPYR